ncbi:MAG: DUF6427 family protein, partial [Bacteroidia bacterium]
ITVSSFKSFLDFHPLQPALFLLLISIYRIFESYRSSTALSNAFDAGLFLGIAILFYFPFFWFMPFLWTCLLIVRPFVWREYALSALGALLPIILAVSYYYLADLLPYLWYDKIVYSLSERKFIYPTDNWLWIWVLIMGGIILLFSLRALFKRLNNSVLRSKNTIQAFLAFSFFSLFIVFVNGTQQAYIFYLFTLPISLLWSIYFVSIKKQWLADLLLGIYLIMVTINQYFS